MGANLEISKFALYLFIPLGVMLHFGDPDWYEQHVAPYKDKLWPKYETTNKPPRNAADLHAELDRLKNEKRAKAGLPPLPPREATATAATPAAVNSDVLKAAGDSRQFNWAQGDKRLV